MSSDNVTSRCLQADKAGRYRRNVQLSPCSTDKSEIWNIDLRGKIISKRYPNYCLALSNETGKEFMKLKLSHCWTEANEKSWRFTSDGQIQYGGSTSYTIKTKEDFEKDVYLAPTRSALAPVGSTLKEIKLRKTLLKDLD